MRNKHQGHFDHEGNVREIAFRVVGQAITERTARRCEITCRGQVQGVAVGGHSCDLRCGDRSGRTWAIFNHKLLAHRTRQIICDESTKNITCPTWRIAHDQAHGLIGIRCLSVGDKRRRCKGCGQ